LVKWLKERNVTFGWVGDYDDREMFTHAKKEYGGDRKRSMVGGKGGVPFLGKATHRKAKKPRYTLEK